MKKKGFTLIELLAVIVILAIIALIATPIILGVIDKAKQGASEQSVNGYINAIENQVMISQLTNENVIEDGIYDLPMNNVEVKGAKPTAGWVKIENGIVKDYSMEVNGYTVTKGKNTKKSGKIENKPDGSVDNPTPEEPVITYKAIVYYNPVSGEKCEASEAVSKTETKTGCMQWYAYIDDGTNYTMILDHNTSVVSWDSNNKNIAYEQSNTKSEIDKLVSESKWKVKPRLITANEIAEISGNTSFDSTDANGWFYLDSNSQKRTANSQVKSKYAWLYDYTDDCVRYGCNTASSSAVYGYWTSTPLGTAGSGNYVWFMNSYGDLNSLTASSVNYGVRPVITIPKSIVS